jgi:hypothetical protein
MSNREVQVEFCRLDRAYREAWKKLCTEIAALQSLESDAFDPAALECARKRVVQAENAYHEARDKLTRHMISKMPAGLAHLAGLASHAAAAANYEKGSSRRRIDLEQLAYRLWEEGGRRHGNAHADWYRAEALICGGQASPPGKNCAANF